MTDEMVDSDGKIIIEDEKEVRKYKKRYSFNSAGIPIGAELIFTRDEQKTCKIIADGEVEYNGECYSLSKLADKLLSELGYNWKAVQGPAFFKYNGKTLQEIKKEIESSKEENEIE